MVALIESSIAFSFASLIGREPAAARTAVAHCGFIAMGRYLPLGLYFAALLAVLWLAGFVASGSRRGALRYMRLWFKHIVGLAALALLIAAVINGIT